jgi:ribosome-associated translation inhibitor RaiA
VSTAAGAVERRKVVVRVSITSPNIHLNDVLRWDAEQKVKVVLGRIANQIDHVSIILTDDNGRRGGVDKQCRVSVTARRLGTVTATGRHVNELASVDKALRRARRIIIQRHKSGVARSRKQRIAFTESDVAFNVVSAI